MADKIGVYSPEELTIILGAVFEVKGFLSNSLVTIQKNTESFKATVGSTGVTERIKKADRDYTIRLALSQMSPTNDVLSSLLSLDELTGRAVFPIFIKDNYGSSLFMAGSCFPVSYPEAVWSDGVEGREWEIYCSDVAYFLGGTGSTGVVESLLGQGLSIGSSGISFNRRT